MVNRFSLKALRAMVPSFGKLRSGTSSERPDASGQYRGPDDRSQSDTMRRLRPLVADENRRAREGRWSPPPADSI
ncbi:hypothetical protein B7C62_15575 [Kitasatospora albolonga]|uniref:Uncharacterized protein n=1 Tax=Kitasatospora albolonga TaxID=68173 RepID=A0ABC8BTY4_9ACTN|nr:hypothetical protein B7C62_15575 [Kitasatospora albolonga]